jgi:membrane protein YqaA with SNARE-associated domain
LKTFLAKCLTFFKQYQAFFQGLLGTVGIWGAFIIALMDSAAFGIPLDPVMVWYAVTYRTEPTMIAVAVFLASLGSAIGSLVPYWIGRKGGEPLLLKKISHARLEQLRDRYESWEFLSIMIPAMLPPPTPMKLIILAAGAFEMRPLLFALALFVGRMLRFAVLTWAVVRYGRQAVEVAAFVVRQHLPWLLASLAILAILVWVMVSTRRTKE